MSRPDFTVNRLRLSKGMSVTLGLLVALVSLAAVVRAQSAGNFLPPHSDSGVDLDGDSFYDVLRVQINVESVTSGSFLLYTELRDGTNSTFIASQSASFFLDGTTTVAFDLSGLSIHDSGIDGPYQADLFLYNDSFELVAYDEHVTAAYLHTDFDAIPATFAPPHSDMGVDTDADTLFDFLEVGARVNVTQAGTYTVEGALFSSSFSFIDSASTTMTFSPGDFTVPIDFTGWTIYASGSDGPFSVSLYLVEPPFTPLDFDNYMTGAYAYTDFETPPAALAPPHSDAGVDSDADGLFNAIAVDVSVSVSQAGTYIVSGILSDSTGLVSLGFDSATETLSAGAHTIHLEFSTLPMVSADIDGPYVATLTMWTETGDMVGSGSHTTAPYIVSEFDPFPAQFGSPHSDRGVDRDVPADGEYNVLEVNVRINVTDPGLYSLNANLLDSSGATFITGDSWVGSLSAGTHTVPLYFPGVSIRSSGFDGPYFVNMTLFVFPPGGFPIPIDAEGYLTQSYNSTDFQSFTPADLTGVVRDAATTAPIPFASVTAFNYLDSFSVFESADGSGNYSLNLYAGDWVVLYNDFEHQANLSRLSFSGTTVYDVDLGPQRPVVNTADLTFTSWDAADVSVRSIGETDNATFRLIFDWAFGNQDQFLDQQEFDTYLASFGVGLPTLPASTEDMFLVDGTPFDLVPGSDSLSFFNITGPVDSTIPPEYELSGSYVSNTTIPAAGSHSIGMQVAYDSPFATNVYTVRMTSPFQLVNFTASPSVAVSGLGTAIAIVDPGPDPNPFDSVTSEWISLDAESTDTAPPTIAGVTASPSPAEAGQPILFAATVTDSGGISSVSVNVSDGTGTSLGNFTITFNSASGKFEISRSFALVGTLSFKVWAADQSGNVASSTGSVVVRDTTPPVANAGPDQSVNQGTTVAFDGTGSSDLLGIASYAWTFNDNGVVSLSGANPSHRFDRAGTFTVTLTVTDTSGNSATDTVVITIVATTGSISGTVVGPSGQGIPGATVNLLSGATEVANTSTDASGHFTFTGVAPGSYTIQVEAAGFEMKTASVAVTAGAVASVSVAVVALSGGDPSGLGLEVWALLIGVILAIVVALFLIMQRRPKPPAP